MQPKILVTCALVLAACGGNTEPAPVTAPPSTTEPPPPPPDGGKVDPPKPVVKFEKCSLETGGNDERAECATIDVPLDWGDPGGRKGKLFVKRLLGTAAERQQVWLLQGGPGGAGDGLESLADALSRTGSLDIYIPDHRGTGRSTYLDCPEQMKKGLSSEADIKGCSDELKTQWGDKLASFSTTTAAHDVGFVIDATRTSGQKVHVYGVSYGTYWAQRYLQLYPTQPSAVTLDSVCQSGICSLSKYGYWTDKVGKRFMAECAQDSFCAGKLGSDPLATMRQALDIVQAGSCAGTQGITRDDMRRAFGMLITGFDIRVIIPAVVHRIVRCNADDVAALKTFANLFSGPPPGGGGGGPSLDSDVLGLHIALSEMEESPPPAMADLKKLYEGALFSDEDLSIRELYDLWPRYSHDAYVGKYPDTKVPILMMNGTLDPQTPLDFAEEVAKHYGGAKQKLVTIPRAAHAVIYQSPTSLAPHTPCGLTIWRQLLADPEATLDTSCTADVMAHDFQGDAQLAQFVFGTSSLWSAKDPPRRGLGIQRTKKDIARLLERPRVPWIHR
jgi:pimeloyl-ACP methyl ester carboxylesterase